MNTNKICFDRNIFFVAIIIIVTFIFYFMIFKRNNTKIENMSKLITKSIFDIEDKMVNEEIKPNDNNYINNYQPVNNVQTEVVNNTQTQSINNTQPEIVNNTQTQSINNTQPEIVNNNIQAVNNQSENYYQAIDNNQINMYNDIVNKRDIAVLYNPLYPPLGRTERPGFDEIINNYNKFNIQTRGSPDTFRVLGYIINKNSNNFDLGGNKWRLFGRQLYRGSSKGEFYVAPVNGDNNDMKIFLKDDMFIGEKIRDIYSLPKYLKFNSPFFLNNEEYELVELPKTDFNSNYL